MNDLKLMRKFFFIPACIGYVGVGYLKLNPEFFEEKDVTMKVFRKKEKVSASNTTTNTMLLPEIVETAKDLGLVWDEAKDNWACPQGMLPNCVPQTSGTELLFLLPVDVGGRNFVFKAVFANYSGSHCASREEFVLSLVPDTRPEDKPSDWKMSDAEKAKLDAWLDDDGAYE